MNEESVSGGTDEWTNSKLQFQLCVARLILLLHLVEFGPQITRLNLSVTTGDSLKDGIMDEYILVLYIHTHTSLIWTPQHHTLTLSDKLGVYQNSIIYRYVFDRQSK